MKFIQRKSGLLVPSSFYDPPIHSAGLSVAQKFGNGKFRVEVRRPDSLGNERLMFDTEWHPQVITNSFFENWLNSTSNRAQMLLYAAGGTDTAEATASDTTLTQVGTGRAAAQSLESSATITGNVIKQRIQYRWAQGAFTVPITSAAIFQAATGGQTHVKSRLKDAGGTPTSIPLTAMDLLYLTWEIDSTVNLSDTAAVITLGGVNYNVTIRPANWTSGAASDPTTCSNPFCCYSVGSQATTHGLTNGNVYNGQSLAAVTAGLTGTNASYSSQASVSYVAGSKQRTTQYTWTAANTAANSLGGIGSVMLHNGSNVGYQAIFAKVSDGTRIPKDATNQLRLDLTVTYGI